MTAIAARRPLSQTTGSSAQRGRHSTSSDEGSFGSPLGSPSSGRSARLLILLVRCYQAVRRGRPSPCRYYPTCSAYAIEAVQRHGAGRGSWLAARRLGRCHPWGGHGADLVPE